MLVHKDLHKQLELKDLVQKLLMVELKILLILLLQDLNNNNNTEERLLISEEQQLHQHMDLLMQEQKLLVQVAQFKENHQKN